MFIYSSHKQFLTLLGYCIQECSLCGQQQPTGVYELTQTDAVYGIELKDTVLQRLLCCEVCGSADAVHRKEPVPQHTLHWPIGQPLSQLAELTGQTLATSAIEPINDHTLVAMMKRALSVRKSAEGQISLKGILTGISGVVVGGTAGWIAFACGIEIGKDDFQNTVLGVLVGGLSGISYQTIKEIRAANRSLHRDELLPFMLRWSVTATQLQTALDREMVNDDRFDRLVDSVREFGNELAVTDSAVAR
ncbi:hypothetical protein GC176_03095 [bacterium]|nr:hypothetical protein [bacterium]